MHGHKRRQGFGQQQIGKVAGHGHPQPPAGYRLAMRTQRGRRVDFERDLAGMLQHLQAKFGQGLAPGGPQQ